MSVKIRRDKNAVTLFDQTNGNKVRLTLGRYAKARVPELVDIKITDYCPFACAFCYQDSTLAGQHAAYGDLGFIASELGKAKVFEVALGGGEPTDHPDFIAILKMFRAHGVVPNFTTKSLGWVKRNWAEIESYAGAFAYSCETYRDVESAAKSLAGIPRDRVNLHYVMGLEDEYGFLSFMQTAAHFGFRVTLLGYKTVGRGSQVDHQTYDWWIDMTKLMIRNDTCPTFSIDTPMAEEYAEVMPVDRRLFHTREGFVSAYIDAVAMGMSASSFENQNLIPFGSDWIKRFKEI